MASLGRYILTPEIFDKLRHQQPGYGGEIQLADSINTMAKNNSVEWLLLEGQRFDCGSIDGYLQAVVNISREQTNNKTA